MCYYDQKSFEFAQGLNIILGHNGDGKSTIFTAFNWIFDPNFELDVVGVFSKKKYSEIIENESFDVEVECVISQFSEEYKIVKSFSVTKTLEGPSISNVKEEIWITNTSTGEKAIDKRSISKLIQQVFPEAFRNFSMFETETDALKIVEGQKLADLVKNFSNAKYYEKLDKVIESFADKADKQFRRESRADQAASDAIEEIDRKIQLVKTAIENLEKDIAQDENGRDFYTESLNDLVKNLTISEDFKKIEDDIEKLNIKIDEARSENKSRNRFTESMFDDFYLLFDFNEIIDGYTSKIDVLRQAKNKVDNDERNKFAKEKLQLENGSTPFPPGFPSLEILEEILSDDICKICNTKLSENAREFINKSIALFNESKKKEKELEIPVVFPNNFIDEFQIINRSLLLKPEKYSDDRIKGEINFAISRIKDNNSHIEKYLIEIGQLENEKQELLAKVPSISEHDLNNIRRLHEEYNRERDVLVGRIGENTIKLETKKIELEELNKTRIKTLSQFKESEFKRSTVDVLEMLSRIAKTVKDEQYKVFLSDLSERATNYLKLINVGEITGKIELYRKNEKEVAYKSLNEDDSLRSTYEDSGALQISKPLSILFAIADMASETADNEDYPMIFDAPTGRYSPDREKEFFRVLKSTKKQRIVVTLRFLGSDDTNTPFVNTDYFQNIEKDRAFFIKRVRPFDKDKPETINTEIEILN
jgi:DNA sulfur modification protein DndD